MLTRTGVCLLLFVACVEPPAEPPAATAEVRQDTTGTCNPRYFPCDPTDPLADAVCGYVCSEEIGGDGYCLPYSAVEEIYCANHPDKFYGSGKYCDLSGNPMWETHCAPGWLP